MVSVLERADDVVAGGLGGGVGGVGLVRAFLVPRGISGGESAVNLVGRNVEETKRAFPGLRELGPVGLHAVEQAEGADDVGLEKGLGGIDGTVDVGLGGEIRDGVDLVLGEELGHEGGVADIAVGEDVARVGCEVGQIGGIAGVSEGVEVDEFRERRALSRRR